MRVICDIKPRRDGTVIVKVGGQNYVFSADESEALACDIESQEDAETILAFNGFRREIVEESVSQQRRRRKAETDGQDQ